MSLHARRSGSGRRHRGARDRRGARRGAPAAQRRRRCRRGRQRRRQHLGRQARGRSHHRVHRRRHVQRGGARHAPRPPSSPAPLRGGRPGGSAAGRGGCRARSLRETGGRGAPAAPREHARRKSQGQLTVNSDLSCGDGRRLEQRLARVVAWLPWTTGLHDRTARGRDTPRSGAYRVFTRKRAFLGKSPVKTLRTPLGGAGKGDFAHNYLSSGRAERPVCQLYTIRSVSQC